MMRVRFGPAYVQTDVDSSKPLSRKGEYSDAIERMLRTRMGLFVKHGKIAKIAAGVTPFESM